MTLLHRSCLALYLATICLLAVVQPAPAQGRKPSARDPIQYSEDQFQRDPRDRFADNTKSSGGVTFNNAAAANAVSGVGSGMIVIGIGMIVAGLALTGGVVFMALQGQKTSYAGGARRSRKKRRDVDCHRPSRMRCCTFSASRDLC